MYTIDILKHTNEYQLNIDLRKHEVDYTKLVEQYKAVCHCVWMDCNFDDTLLITGRDEECVMSILNSCIELGIIKEVISEVGSLGY